nr:MAG TPA: hypothetical protein [Caudoviricetes sp.]
MGSIERIRAGKRGIEHPRTIPTPVAPAERKATHGTAPVSPEPSGSQKLKPSVHLAAKMIQAARLPEQFEKGEQQPRCRS